MTCQTLTELLRNRGLRLADVARSLSVDKSTVTRWAKSQVPSERIEQVSKATGIPANELRPDLASVFTKSGEAVE